MPDNTDSKKTMMSSTGTASIQQDKKGLVLVITGNGKGKTTAAFGLALRAIGHGAKVLVIQFMKGRKYGECLAAEAHLPNLTIIMAGLDSFVMRNNPAPIDIEMARRGLDLARQAIANEQHDMIILDEINVALDFKLIPLSDVIELVRTKPAPLDLVLTGRYAPALLIELADTVSEVREIKHHYNAGIKDRVGIEY